MKREKHSLPPDDDGRTIAPMNVDGMPWYTPPRPKEQRQEPGQESYVMDREERGHYILGAVLAALAVMAVFGLAIFLFIAFCDFIWFR